eukprot:6490862-Amphidinium_carterae.2
MAENMKLYKRNQEQKHEAIWIGQDSTKRQHMAISPNLGKINTRRVLRLPPDQQGHRQFMLKTMHLKPNAPYYYGNSYRKTDRDTSKIPPQLYELRSPTQPHLKQQEGTLQR